MALRIFDTATNVDHWHIALRKHSGRVTAPQLFGGGRPILYSTIIPGTTLDDKHCPVVSGNKWCCYCHDPEQQISQQSIPASKLRYGSGTRNYYVPSLTTYKKTDRNSGLTVAITSLKNTGGDSWSSAALRVTRSSISANFINVFVWAWYDRQGSTYADDMPCASWDNDDLAFDADAGRFYAYSEKSISTPSGMTIDGTRWTLYQRYATLIKPSSGTYLHIAPPWLGTTASSMSIKGWGIVLEPTNSNPYPATT